jgi:hypothetical protein
MRTARHVAIAAAMATVAATATVVAPVAAAAVTCTRTVSWTGLAGDHLWSTGGNWNVNEVPQPGDAVVIAPDPNVATEILGLSGSVCGLSIAGGVDPSTRLAITGSISTGSAHLNGFIGYTAADPTAAPSEISVTGPADFSPGTDLTLADDHANLRIAGRLTVGDATTIRSGQTGSAYPHVFVDGALSLASPPATPQGVTVSGADVDLAAAGTLDTNGATLTVLGPSLSQWAAGATITDTSGGNGGSISLGNSSIVRVDDLTVRSPATLAMTGSAILDGGSAGVIEGTGTFKWLAGSVQGMLTLQQAKTWLTGGGSRFVRTSPPTKLVNKSLFTMDDNGYLRADGDIENDATMVFRPGGSVMKISTATSTFRNAVGGVVRVEAHDPSQPPFPSDRVLLWGVTLRNEGTLDIASGESLYALATSAQLADGGVLSGAGSLQIGDSSTLTLAGNTSVPQSANVLLDDQGDGTKATIVGGDATHPVGTLTGTLTSSGATQASFRWNSGAVKGNVTLAKVASYVTAPDSASHRGLGDGTTPTSLTLGGPSLVSGASISMTPHSALHLAGSAVVSGTSAGMNSAGSQTDQGVTIDPTGSLSVVASSGSGNTPQPSAAVIEPTLVNHGTLLVDGSTLTLSQDYAQSLLPGASASAASSLWTGVSNGGTLQAGATGAPRAVTIAAGGLGGIGTVTAGAVNVDAGWLHPGYSTSPGTLTVNAPLSLTGKSDTRIVIWPPTTGTTAPRYDVLHLTAPATFAGRLTTFTQTEPTKWKPAYLSTLPAVITMPQRTGGFGTVAWGGTPTGLGWRPLYQPDRIDLKLVDVAPPTPTRVVVSAFTEYATGSVSYAAVDPDAPTHSGIASYDVRWRVGSSTKAFGAWRYPKAFQRTTKTRMAISGLSVGWTYCYSIRVRDRAGNQSAWTVPVCSSRMFDDADIAASSGWTRRTGVAGLYAKTYTSTKTYGAVMQRRGTFRRVAVAAYRCSGCGTIGIYSGSHLLKKWNLNAARSGMTSWISPLLTSRTATLRIRNLTAGRMVLVDAVGMAR